MKKAFGAARSEIFAPEIKSREKYELTFPWGSLHVTDHADAAYRLVPLTTQSLESETNRLSTVGVPDFRTDIWLAGPQELDYLQPLHLGLPSIHGRGEFRPTDRGIEVIHGYDKDDKDLIAYFQEQVESGEMELPDDAPPDFLAQYAHQMLTHSFATMIAGFVEPMVQRHLEKDINNMVMSQARKNFLIGLGGGTFISVEQLALYGHVDAFGETMSGALVVGGAMIAYRGVKKYLQQMSTIRQIIAASASQYAQTVAYDINRTYSAEHFNYQAREMFGPTPEDF